MNIYQVENMYRGDGYRYDTYTSMVVFAENKAHAKAMRPDNCREEEWPSNPTFLKVTFLGMVSQRTKVEARIVHTSYLHG